MRILACVLLLEVCTVVVDAIAEESPGKRPDTLVTSGNEIEVLFTPVNIAGATVGFRIEVINLAKQASLILLVRSILAEFLYIELRNTDRFIVSPMVELRPSLNPPVRDWTIIYMSAATQNRPPSATSK
jgi:hypothetical protein